MNILVTGGAGYIGSVVVEECLSAGHKTFVVDNLEKGHLEMVHEDAGFFEGDFGDAALMERIFRDEGIDTVVHMAAYSLVGESVATWRSRSRWRSASISTITASESTRRYRSRCGRRGMTNRWPSGFFLRKG